jgi:hypothetical protein
VSRLRNGRSGARNPAVVRYLPPPLIPKLSDRLWGLPNHPLNGYTFFFVLLEVSGSIPGGATLGIFSIATDGTMYPGIDSASQNEYQGIPLGVKAAGA